MENEYRELFELAQKRIVGFAAYCGLKLEELRPGEAKGSCPLRPELLNPYGYVHGGAIDTLLDTLGGICAYTATLPPRYVVTRSTDIHYLRPIVGEIMRGTACAVKSGRQTCLIRAEAFDGEGRLCAEGLLEFFYTDR